MTDAITDQGENTQQHCDQTKADGESICDNKITMFVEVDCLHCRSVNLGLDSVAM
jgi:hypothetical protein